MKNKMYLLVLVLAVAIIGFCNTVMAQSYGDTNVVASIENLDEEWIVVEKSEQNYTVKYVGGAKYGDIESTISKDMLPENWVVVDIGSTKTFNYTIKYIKGAPNGSVQPVRFLENIPDGWKEYITIDGCYTIRYDGQTTLNTTSGPELYRYKYGEIGSYGNNTQYYNYRKFWLDYKFIGSASYGTIEQLSLECLEAGWISIGVDESNNKSKMKCIKNAKPGDVEYSKLTGFYGYDYDYYLSDGWIVTNYNSTTREAVIKYLGKDVSKQYTYGDTLDSPHIKRASEGSPLPENWVSISKDKTMYIGGRKPIGTKLDIYFSEGEEFQLPNSKNWVWFEYGKTIQYVGIPSYGKEIEIPGSKNYAFWRSIEDIPKGWVYTSYKRSASEKDKIKSLNGAKYGNRETISYEYIVESCNNLLPKGWIIDDYDEVNKICSIKYISGGAGYGTQMTLKRLPKKYSEYDVIPKPPMGWIVTTVDSETYTITCIEGAKFGDVQYMYAKKLETDVLPEGWVYLSYDESTSQLKLTYIKGDVPLNTEVTARQYGCISDFWNLLPDGWICFSRNDGSNLLDLKYYGENYPEIGQTIDFTLKDVAGTDINLNSFKGRNMLIAYNSNATNLNSIIEELPDVQVINISHSGDDDDQYDAINYMLKDPDWAFAEKYTAVQGEITYGWMGSYTYNNWYLSPTYLFVDKDLKIVSKKVQISEKEAIEEAKRLFAPLTPEEEETSIIFGDIDNSGAANSIDFGLMRQYLLGIIKEFSYENSLEAADVDGNGVFNAIDFAFMRKYLLGIINEFPAQNKLVSTPKATATPTITSTIIPTPSPSGGLQIDFAKANPDALFVNQTEDVIFTAGISNFEFDSELTVELNKTDENGNIIEKLGVLNDAGVDGDEMAGDNIYSFKKNMSYSTTQTLHFTITAIQDKFRKMSSIDLRVLNKVTDEEMKENCAFQEEQLKRYVELIDSEGIESAKNVLLSELNSNPKIQQAGVSDGSDSIWFEFKNGILGAISIRKNDETDSTLEESVNTPTTDQTSAEIVAKYTVDSNAENADTSSSSARYDKSILLSPPSPAEVKGPRIANRKVLMLSPMLHEFGINDSNDMNSYTPNVYETLKKYKYNDADVFRDSDITYLKDKEVTVSFLRTELYKYGIISLSSHGDNLFQNLRSEPLWGARDGAEEGQVGFFLAQGYGDSVSTVEKDKIMRDLQMHRLAIFTLYDEDEEKIIGSNYFVLPSFIEKYFQNIYVNNLVLMGCCKSAYNETLSNAFIKSGARTYLGFSDYVPNDIARGRTSLFLSKFLDQSTTAISAYGATDAAVLGKVPNTPGQAPKKNLYIKFFGESNLKPPVPFLDLGTLGGDSDARGINCKGQVVGMSKIGDNDYPVLWEEGDLCKLNDITSWARTINDQSEIFMSYEGYVDSDEYGYYSTMYTKGYRWNKGVVSSDSDFRYLDINNKGQIIGYYTNPVTYKITGFFIDNGTYKDLGNFIPSDINNKGQIIGDALILGTEGVDTQHRGFLYENGVFTDLGSLNSKAKKVSFPGDSTESEFNYIAYREYVSYRDTYGDTFAEAINEKGQIVGSSYIGDDSITQHAFIWENGVMKDLGTLGGENNASHAYDINNEGVVVGGSGSSIDTFHPFLWKNSVMTDLSDVGTFGIVNYKSSTAYSINDLGQVVGNDYSGKAVLWTP